MEIMIYKGGSFTKWLNKLDDTAARRVMNAIAKVQEGNLQDCKPLKGAKGLYEMRVKTSSGYRIYYGHDTQDKLRIILGGSIKRDQTRVIKKAKKYWEQYRLEKKISKRDICVPLKM